MGTCIFSSCRDHYAEAERDRAVLRSTDVITFPTSSEGHTSAAPAVKSRHPHFFVRDAMGADDGQFRKVAMQAFNIGKAPGLNVENDRLRLVLDDVIPEIFVGVRQVNREHRKM